MTGPELKILRESAGMSRKELASRLAGRNGSGVASSLIGLYETGRLPIPGKRSAEIEGIFSGNASTPDAPESPFQETSQPKSQSGASRVRTKNGHENPISSTPPQKSSSINDFKADPNGRICVTVEFGPIATAILVSLIKAIVVDVDDIHDPVVKGFLKHAEGR